MYVDLFKNLSAQDKKINFKQFIFCLYVFLELNIFSVEKDLGFETLIENKKVVSSLDKSQFYNQVNLINLLRRRKWKLA